MTDNRRKPDPNFVVRLVGVDLEPWIVPMRTLTRVLDAVQRLVDQREEDESPAMFGAAIEPIAAKPKEGSKEETRVLHLLGVIKGSAAYPISVPKERTALQIFRETGRGITSPYDAPWSQATLSSLRDLSDVARSLGGRIEIRRPGDKSGKFGDVLATIGPSTYASVLGGAYIYGHTSVYATIERVGGATEMHCGIRVPEQPRKMVICRIINQELARQLGQHLYSGVTLMGEAAWLRHSMELRNLEIHGFEPPTTGSITEGLREIYEAGGNAWDRIKNPDRYLAEVRRT